MLKYYCNNCEIVLDDKECKCGRDAIKITNEFFVGCNECGTANLYYTGTEFCDECSSGNTCLVYKNKRNETICTSWVVPGKLVKYHGTDIKLVNLTPHPIVIDTGKWSLSLPKCNNPLRCPEKNTLIETLKDGIEIIQKEFEIPAELPLQKYKTYYIVSLPVAQAIKRDDFLVPGEMIRNEDGAIIGCKNLCRIP